MFQTSRLASVGLAFCGLVLAASARAGEPPPPNLAGKVQQAYCMSGYLDYNDPNAYFTPVFEVLVPQNAKPSYPEDLAKVYEGYLKQKFGYVRRGPLSVVCTFSVAAAAVEGGKSEVIKDTTYRHRNVIETGWKPSAQEILAAANGAAAPVAAAAPTAHPASTYFAFCKGGQPGYTQYFSAVFNGAVEQSPGQSEADQARATADKWAGSFSASLAERYGVSGSAECYWRDNKGDLDWLWGRLHGLALGRSVDTGWTPAT